MSHFTTIRTKISDLDVLKRTLEELGYPWVEAEIGGDMEIKLCEHLKIMPDSDGYYQVAGDFYYAAGEIEGLNEEHFINELQRTYANLKVRKELSCRGYSIISDVVEDNGEIRMTVRKAG